MNPTGGLRKERGHGSKSGTSKRDPCGARRRAGCDATVYPGHAYGGYPYGGYPIYYGGTSYYSGYWAPGRSYYGGGVYRRAGYHRGGYHGVLRGGYRVH